MAPAGKTPSTRRSPAPPARTDSLIAGANETKVLFGIVISLNGTAIPITTDDIADAVKKGVDFTLPQAVVLGSIADFGTWFTATFGVAFPTKASFPPPLDTIFDKITKLEWKVNEFRLKVPGTENQDEGTIVVLAIEALWPKGEEIPIIKGLSIDGVVFGISSLPPKA